MENWQKSLGFTDNHRGAKLSKKDWNNLKRGRAVFFKGNGKMYLLDGDDLIATCLFKDLDSAREQFKTDSLEIVVVEHTTREKKKR